MKHTGFLSRILLTSFLAAGCEKVPQSGQCQELSQTACAAIFAVADKPVLEKEGLTNAQPVFARTSTGTVCYEQLTPHSKARFAPTPPEGVVRVQTLCLAHGDGLAPMPVERFDRDRAPSDVVRSSRLNR